MSVVTITLGSLAATTALGAAIGASLRPGDRVLLSGDLGSGKTTLARAIGVALHAEPELTSPTFILVAEHRGDLPIWHVDAYRLCHADELRDAGVDTGEPGAIIAIERDVPLSDFIDSGSSLQAKVSADLLTTIFTPYSPLHDGAVIIRGDTIVGAGCILPLSQGAVANRSLGTRHRAALGLAEETDAIVIVVSEETAVVSVARNGALQGRLSPVQLRDLLAGRPVKSAE